MFNFPSVNKSLTHTVSGHPQAGLGVVWGRGLGWVRLTLPTHMSRRLFTFQTIIQTYYGETV
jgi:hypothetical protein